MAQPTGRPGTALRTGSPRERQAQGRRPRAAAGMRKTNSVDAPHGGGDAAIGAVAPIVGEGRT
jgi:hypothetical protein